MTCRPVSTPLPVEDTLTQALQLYTLLCFRSQTCSAPDCECDGDWARAIVQSRDLILSIVEALRAEDRCGVSALN